MDESGLEERLIRELSDLPSDVSVHVWFDPDLLRPEGVRFLLGTIALISERMRTKPETGPVSFDAPGTHVLLRPHTSDEPRIRVVRARLAQI